MASLVKAKIDGGNLRDNCLNREDSDVGQLALNGGYPGFHIVFRNLSILGDAREEKSHLGGVSSITRLCHVDLGGLILQRRSRRLVRLEFGHMKEIVGAYSRIVGRRDGIQVGIIARWVQLGELSNKEPTLKVKTSSFTWVEGR
jgi:hypothetical protein